MIGAAVISDRGPLYLPGCLSSLRDACPDLADDAYVVNDRDHRLGMCGAVNAAWDWARSRDLDYLLHVEEDFRFTAPVPLDDMQTILELDDRLAQVVLKRQPWSLEEIQAGGIIEAHPGDYTDHTDGSVAWTSHRRIFSLNPCLIPRRVFELGWPEGNEAEMTTNLAASGWRFAFYGHRDDPPLVEHVGAVRGNGWRL